MCMRGGGGRSDIGDDAVIASGDLTCTPINGHTTEGVGQGAEQ